MVEAVKDYCLENQILVGDVPTFVSSIVNTPIPFSKNAAGKLTKKPKFDYGRELKPQFRKSINDLPQKIKASLY